VNEIPIDEKSAADGSVNVDNFERVEAGEHQKKLANKRVSLNYYCFVPFEDTSRVGSQDNCAQECQLESLISSGTHSQAELFSPSSLWAATTASSKVGELDKKNKLVHPYC